MTKIVCYRYRSGSLWSPWYWTGHVFADHTKALPYSKHVRRVVAAEYPEADIEVKQESADRRYLYCDPGLEFDSPDTGIDNYAPDKCPRCGSELVLRTAKRGKRKGKQFQGCSQFRVTGCKGTRPITTEADSMTEADSTTEAQVTAVSSNKLDEQTAQTILTALGIAPKVDEALLRDIVREEFKRLDLPIRKVFEIPEHEPVDVGEISHPKIDTLVKLLAGGATRVWITGEAGTGKTHAVEQVCAALKRPIYIITPVTDKYELYGYKDAHGNYQETQLYRWATDPDPRAVLLFDEIDGCHPAALVSANAALANGMAVFPDGQVEIHGTKLVIATANTWGEGPTLKYSARFAQDGALVDRFYQRIHWGLHEPTERQIVLKKHGGGAEPAVAASQRIRQNLNTHGIDLHWGPRRTLSMAQSVCSGFAVDEAADMAGLCALDEQRRTLALKGVI